MTNSRLVAARGSQLPRLWSVPEYVSSAGQEAVELARMAGLLLDPWQEFVLGHSLGERVDGRWAAFEVALVVPRQNGKGAVLEARELAGLFLLGEQLIIHSAHEFATSREALLRMEALIEGCADLSRRVRQVLRSHGDEGFVLRSGQRLRYKTRTKGGGRGFSANCVVLDEAMILPGTALGALLPTVSAQQNPQIWYAGSAVDQLVHEHGVVLSRIRERGIRGDDPALAFFEWSVDGEPSRVDQSDLADRERWACANPGLGIRISEEHVEKEQRSLDPRTFAVERLGVGDWPSADGEGGVIPFDDWLGLFDEDSEALDPVCFAFAVAPDRSSSAIAAAGLRDDGRVHVEVVDHAGGAGWIVPRLVELVGRHGPRASVCDGKGPAGSFLPSLEAAGVDVLAVTGTEYARACGLLVDAVTDGRLRHLATPELSAAVRRATKRPLGESWAWSRKGSGVDITPLEAATLAFWAAAAPLAKDSTPMLAFVSR